MVNHRRKKNLVKFIITFVNLIIFNYVILYADKFQVKLDNLPVRADFVTTSIDESSLTAVRLDNVIIADKAHGGNITYVIKPGDTLASIAQSIGTTISNIRMANGLPGDVDVKRNGTIIDKSGIALRRLTISQLPGIVIAMDSTTSVREFASQYSLNEEDIKALNNISDSKTILRAGDELFLTITEQDAIQKGILEAPSEATIPDVVLADANKPAASTISGKPTPAKPVLIAAAPKATSKPKAQIVRTENNGIADYDEGTILASWFQKDGGYAGFAAGNCTSYAASRRPDIFGNSGLRFRGNAKSWYANAKAAGNAVGKTAKVGAIVVFGPGRGASGYGHVGIVEEVGDGKIVISDMNYKGKYVVTKRVVDADLPMGYIY